MDHDAEIAFLIGRLKILGVDVEGLREKQLELALSMAMDILMKIVDSDRYPIGVRCDAQQLVKRWQRGEFLKSNEEKS